ncbi:Anaphase-promoting complex subunit 5 [Entomortierella chlamydospora]|uniref:Anaphase-promoting complex subunit 5 n=1 Tax=Entomortierella chlamydospora TaxID=101097 RepID=A0A9P6SXA4_9FUNG|nr:Anaphase-promoting complex subunit 5 [Entomortierella chlamydospora]
MSGRRPFARTATDISLRPPQAQGFNSSEQGIAAAFANDHLNGTATGQYGFNSGPVHVVSYLTPHKVSVLILIEYYCQCRSPLPSVQNLLLFLLKCIQDPMEYLHDNVNKFGSVVTSEVGSDVWTHVCVTLKRIKSPHHLSDFFLSKLEMDVADPKDIAPQRIGLQDLVIKRGAAPDPESIMGLYVRKARLEFKKLSFEDMCKFYTALETYISAIGKSEQNPESSRQPSITSKNPTVLSSFDVEKYLDHHTQRLSELGQADIPEELLAHVYSIQSRMPSLAKTHYITCLHAQQTGDFEVAIQSLHRFFDYCMAVRDRELYQYALLNLAMLHARFSHFEQALIQGESMPKALGALVKASSINLRHSLDGAGGIVQLFQSKIWGAYGYSSLSSLYSQLQLQYRPSETDMNDAASGYSKTASDLALAGRFEEALRVINLAKTKFPLKTMKATPWIQTLVQILHRRAVSTNQLRDAEIWTQQLGTALVNTSIMASVSDSGDSKSDDGGRVFSRESQLDDTSREVQLEIILQKAILSVLVGQGLSGAHQLSEGLAIVQQNQWPGMHKFTVMYLLALAEIYMDSDSAISAMPLLLTAMTLSEHNLQRPLSLLVKLRLSEVLLYLDSVKQANDLVEGLMSMVLSQGDVYVQSLAYFQRAKCLLARVDKAEPLQTADDTRRNQLKYVIEHLERALEGFQRIESLKDIAQVLYFRVRVFHMLGQADDIENALHLFKASSIKLSSGKNSREPSWFSYYYTRDSFEGILGIKDEKSNPESSGAGTLNKLEGPSKLGQKKAFGFTRTGSSQWSTLRRTPSQLWQSTTASEPAPALPPPDEREEVSGIRSEEESMDIDMADETGRSLF